MFPLNNKSQNIGTRKPEKFKVQHALTDKLKDSALIYMQNLLNEHVSQILQYSTFIIDPSHSIHNSQARIYQIEVEINDKISDKCVEEIMETLQ